MLRNVLVCFVVILCFTYSYCEDNDDDDDEEEDYLGNCRNGNTIIKLQMTEEDRTTVLNAHNKYRRMLSKGYCNQPKAVGLQDLVYDEDLEDGAYAACISCKFEHNIYNDDPDDKIGQNMAEKKSNKLNTTFDWQHSIDAWMNECKQFTYPTKSVGVTGHYEQIAAERTERVGCYGIIHKNSTGPIYQRLYFCNYFPSGNINNEAPYLIA